MNGFNYASNRHLGPWQVTQLRQTGKMTRAGKWIPSWLTMQRARKGPTLIHRVDGVPELVRGQKTRADRIQPAVNRLTDHTIFQSEFCRASFTEHCGVAPTSWRIIKNAVDPQIFSQIRTSQRTRDHFVCSRCPGPRIPARDSPLCPRCPVCREWS